MSDTQSEDELDSSARMIVCITYLDEVSGKRLGRNYGFWKPKLDMSHLEEVRAFVNHKHGGAKDIEATLYFVEDVTATFNAAHLPGHVKEATTPDEKKISIAANSIGYALQEASVELDAELVLKAAQRLADQGLLK